MTANPKSIPINELAKHVKKVALRSKEQVINGRPGDNKKPWGKWNSYPKDYTGYNDPKYPTGFICDFIPELGLHLGIIDLDVPKEDNHIALNTLKSMAVNLISGTYSVQTASGGYHIYFLSKRKPEAKSIGKLNIDYQCNTGKGNGKYIIADYRWNKEGNKEYYTRLVESPKEILIVDSIDRGFIRFLQDLDEAGYIKTAQNELKSEIVSLLKPYVRKGERQKFSCALAGYLRKQGYEREATKAIIKKLFDGDEELNARLNNVQRTYDANIKKVIGIKYLQNNLPPRILDDLQALTINKTSNLRNFIAAKLLKHKEPRPKEIADLINSEFDFYINPRTQIYYERLEDCRFKQIDHMRIVDYCNETFGCNQISDITCKKVLPFITKTVEKNYNLLEFNNGFLNTETRVFTQDKTQLKCIPKLTLPFKWNSEADGGYVQEIFEQILGYDANPNNMELWLKIVGHAFMAKNHVAKFMVVVGPPCSGKSTLSTALERIFNVSRIGTNQIVKNERFTLLDMIDKDINIDDDINNGTLKGIGFFNTVVAGHTITIEKKGLNELVVLENEQIPILIANGNTLPPVIGEGFSRRLALIKAHNIIPEEQCDELFHARILEGQHDSELEWLVHKAITEYWNSLGKPFVNAELKKQMNLEYEFQSHPEKKAIEGLFHEDYDEGNILEQTYVMKYVKIWCKWAYEHGKISKEHERPSAKKIKNAIDQCGFERIRRENGYYYVDIYMDEGIKTLLDNYLIDKREVMEKNKKLIMT